MEERIGQLEDKEIIVASIIDEIEGRIEKLEKRIKLLERMLYTRWCGITKLQPDAGDGAFEDFIKAYEKGMQVPPR